MTAPALSVVIVNWNAGDALRRAVHSVHASGATPVEVIVVDNASSDGSLDALGDVRILRLERNAGFALGCNAGLDAAVGRHALLLNPDARVLPGALDALVAVLEREPDAGVVAGRIEDESGGVEASVGRFPGLARGLMDWGGRLLGRRSGAGVPVAGGPVDVDWVSGAFLALSEAALGRGIRLDPRYPLYFEDVDLCRAVHAAGLRVCFVPETWAVHARGGTPAGDARRRLRRLGELRYHRKWGGAAGWPLVILYAILSRAWEPHADRLPSSPLGPGEPGRG